MPSSTRWLVAIQLFLLFGLNDVEPAEAVCKRSTAAAAAQQTARRSVCQEFIHAKWSRFDCSMESGRALFGNSSTLNERNGSIK